MSTSLPSTTDERKRTRLDVDAGTATAAADEDLDFLPTPDFPILGDVEIKYRDEYLVVISKPFGLLSVPGRAPDNKTCVASVLKDRFDIPNALSVHRLDQETSGLMVFALDKAIHSNLSTQFQQKGVMKSYTALVWGIPTQDEGTVDLALRYDPINRPRHMVDIVHGKPSLTRWKVKERYAQHNVTLMELIPETGRSHQLRLHMLSTIGPILGDSLYAEGEALQMTRRMCLHATTLSFIHPKTKERINVESQPPSDWWDMGLRGEDANTQ